MVYGKYIDSYGKNTISTQSLKLSAHLTITYSLPEMGALVVY